MPSTSHAALETFRLTGGLPLAQPLQARQVAVTPDSPARQVMTDLTLVRAATIAPGSGLRQAEQTMIFHGVRLLFVTEDVSGAVLGLVGADDLHGDRALRQTHERRVRHDELQVADVMTPLDAVHAIDIDTVRHATVRQVAATLARYGRAHLLVVQAATERTPHRLRGLFSRTQIERQLGQAIAHTPVAETFAEIEQALA